MVDNETKQFYIEEIKLYKTKSSKKAFLTRIKKEVAEQLGDLEFALKESWKGRLFGKYVYREDLWEREDEITFINNLYKKIDK